MIGGRGHGTPDCSTVYPARIAGRRYFFRLT